MSPVEGQVITPMGGPQGVPQEQGAGTIPLSTLIEFIVQRTYHELTILSELLPRKTDMERKIEIVQFASRTRQLFIRLLALVKWANSASKVDKCAMICSFLDSQSLYFVDTADKLARMARETLVHARLPSFSLPCAIDVLTTGTYSRLPSCIKERILPPDPITPQEKQQTLLRLNQIIEHRLVTCDLPPHMHRPKIRNGRVKFRVEHEFEVTLTLMGEGPNIPWRLLDIEILVEDPETGDGKSLVHSLQITYIHQLIQSRLLDNENRPLHDLYNCLHSFSQSLQLEVMQSQTQRLKHQRLGENVRIEEYTAGKSLVLSYWRDPTNREVKPYHMIYKLSIHVDETDKDKPLQITHFPQILGSESTKVSQAIRSDHLSVEKLLIHTIQVRSLAKLKDLERELRLIVPGPCEIKDLPTLLYVPALFPCTNCEKLCVAVDIMTGAYLTSIAEKVTSLTADIEECVNTDRRDLRRTLSKLRLWLALQRCKKSIQHNNSACYDQLPLANLGGHPLEGLGKHKLYIKIAKHPAYYLIVDVHEARRRTVDYRYYLLHTLAESIDKSEAGEGGEGGEGADGAPEEDLPQSYLKAGHLLHLDAHSLTHGPLAKLLDNDDDESPAKKKRRLLLGPAAGEPPVKKTKASPYFVPELTHILALCEDKIPFMDLDMELRQASISHQGIQVDEDGSGLCLTLLTSLHCPGLSDSTVDSLQQDLLSCKFRIQKKGARIWMVETVFVNCPLKSTSAKEKGPVHRVFAAYDLSGAETTEKVVKNLLDDWACIAHLYDAVLNFADIYKENPHLSNGIEIKSYTYSRLTLAYGPNKCYSACIQYKMSDQKFHLSFGTCGAAIISNCHTLVASQLAADLNTDRSIAQMAQVLLDSWYPLSAIGKLPLSPMTGVTTNKGKCPPFTIIPQSSTHVRITFRNMYCVDIHMRGNRQVAVRDGSYSMFDTSKVVEGLTPIPGLKAFLNMYVEDMGSLSHAQRRRSTTEDDNPPSPIGMDPVDSFMASAHLGSPATRGQGKDDSSMRFPMTPTSNPHTPASPRESRMPGSVPQASPAQGSFPLSSPPSLQPVVTPSPSHVMAPSPSNPTLHVPSPSSFVPAPSPSSLGIHMPSPATQFISPIGMVEGGGSPYPSSSLAMPSPGAGSRNWPGSPGMAGPSPVSRHTAHSPGGGGHPALHSPPTGGVGMVMSPPSRILPQRSWAASMPTLLSHDALNKLLSANTLPGTSASAISCCPLERFLSSVYLRRHIQRVVQSDDQLRSLPCNEPGVVMCKVDSLQFRITLNPNNMQCLILRANPTPDYSTQWDGEEITILEKFFELRVACPPYKANPLTAFGRLLGAPFRVMRDCIQIMRLELQPEPNLKWAVQWCLTLPHGAPPIAEVGTAAVVIKVQNNKTLFMLKLTRLGPTPPGTEPQTVIVPVLYDLNSNITQIVDPTRSSQPSPAAMAISNMFKRFADFNPQPKDCSIYPAIRELLSNLVIPH